MAIRQLVRRLSGSVSKYKPKVSKFGLHTRQDISSAVGTATKRGGDLAAKLGLNNLSNTLHKNAPRFEKMAYKHPVKTALGATGLIGGLRYNKYRRNNKKRNRRV